MNQPTREQSEKFWEWCGFTASRHPTRTWLMWYTPGDRFFANSCPSIDLNNLFRYAAPKLDKVKIIKNPAPSGDVFWNAEVSYDGVGVVITHEDPALALFWAIWEVIK